MKPLTTKQRSSSLIFLGIIFVLVAPVIVLLSLGYRLDGDFTFQKTGGIFVHSDIANASVFVDDEFLKTNGAFFRNTLIQDLIPNKKYKIEVHKDNYQSWVKEIYVYPSIVSEGSVLMLPNEFEKRELFKYIDRNGVATSTLFIKNQPKPTNPEFISISELFASSTKSIVPTTATTASTSTERQKSKIELFFDTLKITNFEKLQNLVVQGDEVSWIEKGNINLYWMDELVSIPYYYCGGEEVRTCENKITLDWKDEIKRFDYFPGRTDVWIILTSHGIYAVEVDGRTQRNIQTMYMGENLDFRLTQTDRLIIKEKSRFFEINL
jgi:hypothetical protein